MNTKANPTLNQMCRATALSAIALTAALPCLAGTPEGYRKQWRNEAINKRIDQNIEKHRKADAEIEVIDAAGKPVRNAKVALCQTSHDFLFGCNAFVLGQLQTEELNRQYEQTFAKVFNFATVPFYWEGTEPTRGELRYKEEGSRDIWRRPPPDRFLPWAARNNITLKGHPLLWHAYNPPWLPQDADELRTLYKKRFKEISDRYADKINIWDVVNESQVCNKKYPLYSADRSYVGWAFEQVTPLFPEKCTLMINEVTEYNFKPAEQNPYFTQVKTLLAEGKKVRGIGFQYHFFRREKLDKYLASADCNPATLLDLYEKFGDFNLPMYVTEITFPSAGPEGDDLQAEVVRDHYRLWFCAPNMAGITWWNLGDGTAVKGENEAKGGLLDGDLKPKPAYSMLDRLVNTEWTTKTESVTSNAGKLQFRGFCGSYSVTVEAAGHTVKKSFHLQKSSKNKWIITL